MLRRDQNILAAVRASAPDGNPSGRTSAGQRADAPNLDDVRGRGGGQTGCDLGTGGGRCRGRVYRVGARDRRRLSVRQPLLKEGARAMPQHQQPRLCDYGTKTTLLVATGFLGFLRVTLQQQPVHAAVTALSFILLAALAIEKRDQISDLIIFILSLYLISYL